MVIQGVYIFRKGIIAPFFLEPRGGPPCSAWTRFIAVLVHLGGGAGLLAITSDAIAHRVRGTQVFNVLAILTVFVLPGILFFIRPVTLSEWTRHAHPGTPTSNRGSLIIARVIGAGMIFVGLWSVTFQ
jgi:hypothetical protein